MSMVFLIFLAIAHPAVASSNKVSEDSYCQQHERLRQGEKFPSCQTNNQGQETTIWKDRICPPVRSGNLKFLLSLFLIIAWGALVRTFLRATKLNIPYTVILMLTGTLIGLGTRLDIVIPSFHEKNGAPLTFCSFWSGYTKLARTHPKIILYFFLPILIFESAFNMKVHVIRKSAWQILMISLPGMVITTGITAAVCRLFMHSYRWTFAQACLFGSIISATDPVAVVAILRELGISDTLSTMIEGESLLNDGIAFVMYEVFEDIVRVQSEGSIKIGEIFIKFLSISIGGPLLGAVTAKIAVMCLSLIFNDSTVEITITLVAAYATYYFGEALGVSGVVAVVILGIRLNADSTCISPNSVALVHQFWVMLGYLANTVLFVLVGIVISETAINQISMLDILYLLLLYVFVNAIRLLMLTILMPFLSRIGYGLKWKEMIVMMWGGVRGAVGLCLALEVYRNKELCLLENDRLGPKILFHTAGIVMLTLIINGTSTKLLISCLKLDEASQGQMDELNNAIKHIHGAQMRALAAQKHIRFLADANWDLVDQFTGIGGHFQVEKKPDRNIIHLTKVISGKLEKELHKFKKVAVGVHAEILFEAKEAQYTENARLHLLKGLKIFFWRQYREGVITDSATQILVNVTEIIEDRENQMIRWEDYLNHFQSKGLLQFVKNHTFTRESFTELSYCGLARPKNRFRKPLWWLATTFWFERILHLIVLVNLIPVILETVLQIKSVAEGNPWSYQKRRLVFLTSNVIFTIIYTSEFLVKIIAFGWRYHWADKTNLIDIVLIFANITDIVLTLAFEQSQTGLFLILVLTLRLGFKTLQVVRPWLPQMHKFIDGRTKQLFLEFDIGTGFVSAVDDILKFLPQIAQHPKIFKKFDECLKNERFEALRSMSKFQKDHPQIATAVKTRQASRTVLNQMTETLKEIRQDGLLDDKDGEVLVVLLEERMKIVLRSPSNIVQPTPEAILENVTWILGHKALTTYIHNHAVLKRFTLSDTICTSGDPPGGIYIIFSGMIKMHYVPSAEIIAARSICGQIPNKDFFMNLSFEEEEIDVFSTGTVIGELGILTGQKVAATIKCETNVIAYYISSRHMKNALEAFNVGHDPLESRIWRSCGLRVAAALLQKESAFQAWTRNKMRLHIERSAVPIRPFKDKILIPDFISTAILLNGKIMDSQTRDVFTAPCILPQSSTKFIQCEDSIVEARIMLIAKEEIDYYEERRPCSGHHSAVKRIGTPSQSDMLRRVSMTKAINLRGPKN